MRMNSSSGEIIEVQGGHIVRSTNRKDRHSKVFTSKGPRDRRVRLSAHTAIEFYDVQDRLGYDRPSKAVDWLIKKSKTAIDKLAELPPWHPSSCTNNAAAADPVSTNPLDISMAESSEYRFQFQGQLGETETQSNNYSTFDQNPLDPMRSFFPKCSSETNSINYQGYPPEIISKATNQAEDLCLSLHPFQDSQVEPNQNGSNDDETLFAGSASMGIETSSGGWSMGRFQRMLAWENGGDMQNRSGGFIFNSPMPSQPPQLIGQSSQFSHQRGPIQPNFPVQIASSPSVHYRKRAAHQSSVAEEYPSFSHTSNDSQREREWGGS